MQPLLEVKQGRLGYFIASFFTLLLFFVFLYTFLDGLNYWDDPEEGSQPVSVYGLIMSGVFMIPTLFLLYFFSRSFIKNPVVFALYNEGFVCNTNGVSTGFINWSSMVALEEVIIVSNSGSGTRREAALAIHLSNMEDLTKQLPGWARFFYSLAGRSGRFRFPAAPGHNPDAVPIMIAVGALGRQYPEVIALMQQLSGLQLQKNGN